MFFMEYCIACTMPLASNEEIGAQITDGPVCIHCADGKGGVKSCAEIFEGGVQFFLMTFPDMDRTVAERVTRKNMRALPYWHGKGTACLEGEEATDEEFQSILERLQ